MNTRTTSLPAILSALVLVLVASTAQALALHSLKAQQLEVIYGTYAPRGDCQREPRIMVNERGFDFEYQGRTTHSQTFDYAVAWFSGAHAEVSEEDASKRVFFPSPIGVSEGKWGPEISNLGPLRMIIDSRTHKLVIEHDYTMIGGRNVLAPLTSFQAALLKHSPYARCRTASTSSNASSAAANGTIKSGEVRNPTPAQIAAIRRAAGSDLDGCTQHCFDVRMVDLNDDGRPDLIVRYTNVPGACSLNGCSGIVVMTVPGGYSTRHVRLPTSSGFSVLPGKHHGVHDLLQQIVVRGGRVISGSVLKWNGTEYR